ncbi:MAG: hypothetical protein ABFS45_07685 [Pseudomonadota bacterium]
MRLYVLCDVVYQGGGTAYEVKLIGAAILMSKDKEGMTVGGKGGKS